MAGLLAVNLGITLLSLGYQLIMTCYSLDYHFFDRSMSGCAASRRLQWTRSMMCLGRAFRCGKWLMISGLETCFLQVRDKKSFFFVCETLGKFRTSLLFLWRTDNSTPMNLGCRADFQSTMMEVYKQALFSITNSFRLVCACVSIALPTTNSESIFRGKLAVSFREGHPPGNQHVRF